LRIRKILRFADSALFVVISVVVSTCYSFPLHMYTYAQFVHQLFNVSTLLLNDALLKCVVSEVVLFSVVAFKTNLRCGGIFISSTITYYLLILTVKKG